MSSANLLNAIQTHSQVLLFPKGGNPFLTPNDWLVWDAQDEDGLPLEYANLKVLVPFSKSQTRSDWRLVCS